MRIAVNTRLLLPGKLDGIGWFTYHTLSRITRLHPEIEFIFFFDRKWSPEFIFGPNVTAVSLFPQARHPFLFYLWFEWAIPAALKKYKADLFLSPDGYLSLSTNTPQVAVIHDLNFEHYPQDLPFLSRNYYRHYFPKFALKAAQIATVSEFSRNDIVTTYGIASDKIDVVYNGVNEKFKPVSRDVKNSIQEKYSGGNPYFLFVGMLHQRKNIAGLLKAYEQFRKQSDQKINLIFVGHKKWWSDEMESVFSSMSFKQDVIFLGRQPIDELIKITGSALALMYVSSFEGFGVPILEAMRCGVPVIASNVTSMPEVSGDAAMLIDPFNISSITEAMIKISSDNAYASKLAALGIANSDRFSWDLTSRRLWKCIEKVKVP